MGELAERTNVSKRTIDYYTKIGLLHPRRSDSNYRLYDEEAVEAIEMVKRYKKMNCPLYEIKDIIDMLQSKKLSNKSLEMHVDHIAQLMQNLEKEIKDMQQLMDHMNREQRTIIREKLSKQSANLVRALLAIYY
ncbi:MerR family transcriptional regulator [Aeribacillus composti]|nr:MerR family transcriptional regulator [Aeribacillus pallidus]MED1440825.1 MerR family transcriptional regulator [Aeribacillus composti]